MIAVPGWLRWERLFLARAEYACLGLRTHDAGGGVANLLVSPTKDCKIAAKFLLLAQR